MYSTPVSLQTPNVVRGLMTSLTAGVDKVLSHVGLKGFLSLGNCGVGGRLLWRAAGMRWTLSHQGVRGEAQMSPLQREPEGRTEGGSGPGGASEVVRAWAQALCPTTHASLWGFSVT